MAYFKISSLKNGTLKAKIQALGKDTATGKQKLFVKSIVNTDGLTEAKFRKFVEREAIAFEESLKKAFDDQVTKVRTRILTFPELMAEWKSTIKATLSLSYYEKAVDVEQKFNAFLLKRGLFDAPISEITVRDIQMFLNEYSFGTYIAGETARLKKPLPKQVNFRELAREGIITRCSSYNMKQGDGIKVDTAKKICEYYNLLFEFYFEIHTVEKQYAQETVKGYRRVLRTVFNEAYRYDWIPKNPVCRTKIGTGSGNTSLRTIEEKEVFTIAEVKAFSQALDNLPYDYINNKVMVKIMLLCGLRNAELHGLRWEDIDFDERVIHVRRNRLHSSEIGYYEKSPKTKTSTRDVPIPDSLLKDLQAYFRWFLEADDEFEEKLGVYYVAANVYREPECSTSIGGWLRRFEKTNGFKLVSCHGLRHTYCSMLLSQNVPIQTVSKYMGHSDSTVTLQVYSHFIADTQERAINALNSIID